MAVPAAPFHTALVDPVIDAGGADAGEALRRVRAAGATYVRVDLYWEATAPVRPAGDATDPDNPAYRWQRVDGIVRDAVARGLTPVLMIAVAPTWARQSAKYLRPDVGALAAFATAAARRFSGSHAPQPRVRHWIVWNEPNFVAFLTPQDSAVDTYRSMLNATADAIHGVRRDNVVVAGALAPGVQGALLPLDFARRLLEARVSFDAFAVHPYTWGGPTRKAEHRGDLALGDLPAVRTLLAEAERAGRIVSSRPVELWVTEFSYDTNPPDPNGLPPALQARWTSQALFQMWRNGVRVATWFLLRDLAPPSPFQSGLYLAGPSVARDVPKPTLRAFRFPFVAFPTGASTQVWGRVPGGVTATVRIERRARPGATWRLVRTLRADRYGIFRALLPGSSAKGAMRARLVGGADVSVPFGLAPVPDHEVSPFG